MQFNSLIFGFFFVAIFLAYWPARWLGYRAQNVLLLLVSAVFFAWWDYRFLLLLYGAAIVDYAAGWGLVHDASLKRRKFWLGVSLTVNLCLLGFFKYYNFFAESFVDFVAIFGIGADVRTLNLILPLGISFFTFQRLTYTIELYRKRIEVTRDLVAFLCFSGFFPVVTAGPIERANRLLPQFLKARNFDVAKAKDALRQILWGLFRKIVIADNLVAPVAEAFGETSRMSGMDLGVGVFLFAIQIYVDFAAYSDIAMGCGKLLGFRIMRNFAYPYFSRDIAEFWRRWHISMSFWFRDYVYTPLSMHVSLARHWRRFWNVMVTFTVSGLWHGANWTFVAWGFLHGLFFIPHVFGKPPQHETAIAAEGKLLPNLREIGQLTVTFVIVTLAWVFFRADSLGHAFAYFSRMFTATWLVMPKHGLAVIYSLAILALEWIRRERIHSFEIQNLPVVVRWGLYLAVVFAIAVFGEFGVHDFYYAQF
ncbi:MBOAT family protein [bacterium]|nr:MBOAT family protein [bacterium]